TYGEAQAAVDGAPSEAAAPLLEPVIRPLFAAYAALAAARERRSPLELDLPERRVRIGESGEIASIELRERFDAHRLVEEFMILANVAAAEALETRRVGLLYRVHEEPTTEKIEALREILHSAGVPLAKGQVMTPRLLNRALAAARGTENAEMINISVLRAQTQAYYWPENLHHFGLALRSYAHFTSPIRRYADLIVHRALIRALGLGADPRADGLSALEEEGLADTAEHISMTERRAMAAERDTTDRYLARHLSDAEGAEFEARISGVQRFGLFVKLEETGADGFVPISTLEGDRFRHDEAGGRLIGERSRLEIPLGATARVRLLEATPVSGGLVFELTDWRAVARKGDGARRGASTLKKGKRPAKPKGIGARLAKRRGRPKR
ncbi:MAG: RNB domain-containing ribonuclease, partial [Pseudomonadota bacterium]